MRPGVRIPCRPPIFVNHSKRPDIGKAGVRIPAAFDAVTKPLLEVYISLNSLAAGTIGNLGSSAELTPERTQDGSLGMWPNRNQWQIPHSDTPSKIVRISLGPKRGLQGTE